MSWPKGMRAHCDTRGGCTFVQWTSGYTTDKIAIPVMDGEGHRLKKCKLCDRIEVIE